MRYHVHKHLVGDQARTESPQTECFRRLIAGRGTEHSPPTAWRHFYTDWVE